MSDRVLNIYSPCADFSTAEWGVLKIVSGEVDLDRPKAFNRARRVLHAGGNAFGILRTGIWETVKPFDYKDKNYWPLLKEYVGILHQPSQNIKPGQKGALVIIDPFIGCGEDWQYSDHAEAKRLLKRFFAEFADCPWVRFSCGRQLNAPAKNEEKRKAIVRFHKEVLYPCFHDAGLFPFAYGPTHDIEIGLIEDVKGDADREWKLETTKIIFRAIHGVKDGSSPGIIDAIEKWGKGPIRIIVSMDGVFNGSSECDYLERPNGQIHRRPSKSEWKSAVKYTFETVKQIDIQVPLDTKLKIAFEVLPKASNKDACSAQNVEGTSEECERKTGKRMENRGQYPDDWVEPSPLPPPTIVVEICKESGLLPNEWCPARESRTFIKGEEPVTYCGKHQRPCSDFLKYWNILGWLRCVLFGKH